MMIPAPGTSGVSEERSAALRVVGLAASAGGLKALLHVLSALPADFPAAVLVVQHVDPRHKSWMAEILDRKVSMPVRQVVGGERLAAGAVWVAPPDRHLLVDAEGLLSLVETPRVQFVRPSADRLFASLAEGFGARAIAVVLTGTGRDGAAGVRAVKARGGTVIVQDEVSSEHFGMPGAAIATGLADRVLPLSSIAPALCELVGYRG